MSGKSKTVCSKASSKRMVTWLGQEVVTWGGKEKSTSFIFRSKMLLHQSLISRAYSKYLFVCGE